MTTELRQLPTHPADPSDQAPLSLMGSQARMLVSARYGLELEICEQLRPIRGWVIVASRKGRRYRQLPGVFTTCDFAKAHVVMLLARWGQRKSSSQMGPDSASARYWALEWNREEDPEPETSSKAGVRRPSPPLSIVARS